MSTRSPILLVLVWLSLAVWPSLSASEPTSIETRFYQLQTDLKPRQAKELAKILDSYHLTLVRLFELEQAPQAAKLPVRIYGDREAFIAYGTANCGNFNREWYGYYLYDQSAELVIYFDGQYHGILFHEGIHQFMHAVFPDVASWPQWFNEGLAALMESSTVARNGSVKLPTTAAPRSIGAVKQGSELDLQAFMRLSLADWQLDHYAPGAVFMQFWLLNQDEQIKNVFRTFMIRLRDTRDYDTAFQDSIGKIDLALLAKAFKQYVGSL